MINREKEQYVGERNPCVIRSPEFRLALSRKAPHYIVPPVTKNQRLVMEYYDLDSFDPSKNRPRSNGIVPVEQFRQTTRRVNQYPTAPASLICFYGNQIHQNTIGWLKIIWRSSRIALTKPSRCNHRRGSLTVHAVPRNAPPRNHYSGTMSNIRSTPRCPGVFPRHVAPACSHATLPRPGRGAIPPSH